jgi:teichuronic acid biosynthesis glycosyltransferase TuaG
MTAADGPLVSVITPVYNADAFLTETLDSVARQTFAAWEHLLVDDGSRDSGPVIVRARAESDPRVRPLTTVGRQGALNARNTGLAAAQGRYVAFLDADDLWQPDKLARQVAFMRETGAAISHTGYRRFDHDSGEVGRLILPPKRIVYRQLLANTAITMSTGMVDTRQFADLQVPEGGHPSLRSDLRFWLRCLRDGAVAYGLAEDLARYRVVRGSLSSNPVRSAYWVWRTYRDCEGIGLLMASRAFAAYALRAAKKRVG